jgi:hypothetical protein
VFDLQTIRRRERSARRSEGLDVRCKFSHTISASADIV